MSLNLLCIARGLEALPTAYNNPYYAIFSDKNRISINREPRQDSKIQIYPCSMAF